MGLNGRRAREIRINVTSAWRQQQYREFGAGKTREQGAVTRRYYIHDRFYFPHRLEISQAFVVWSGATWRLWNNLHWFWIVKITSKQQIRFSLVFKIKIPFSSLKLIFVESKSVFTSVCLSKSVFNHEKRKSYLAQWLIWILNRVCSCFCKSNKCESKKVRAEFRRLL